MEKALTMSKKKETKETKEYVIEKIEIAPSITRLPVPIYTDILNDVLKSENGFYKVSIPNKKSMSIFVALQKRIKKQNISNLKVHIIKDSCYLEKIS